MKTVSINSIEQAVMLIDGLDDDGFENIANSFAKNQPILLAYANSAVDEYQNEKLEGLLIYYFCLIIESFKQEEIQTNEISESIIDEFEESFFQVLDQFFQSDNLEDIEEFTDQANLIQFMAMEISTPDTDGTELDDETATQLFIVTIAVIALLSKSASA